MRNLIRTAGAAAVAATATTLLAVSPAGAAGPALGCHVAPNPSPNYTSTCGPDRPAGLYTASFMVLAPVAGSTYGWSWTGADAATPAAGCTATSTFCNIQLSANGRDRFVTGTVRITRAGVTTSATALASIPATCGRFFC